MPLIPTSNAFTDLRASAVANNETGLADAIVVRGYLGPPTEVLEQANAILAALAPQQGVPAPPQIPANVIQNLAANAGARSPWRIYLTPRGDCWMEVPDWGRCVARVLPETSTDRVDAYTVWLRTRNSATAEPERYRVVTTEGIDSDGDRFVSGRLIEDYMSRRAAGNVAWDEQQFGPTTGKISIFRCF